MSRKNAEKVVGLRPGLGQLALSGGVALSALTMSVSAWAQQPTPAELPPPALAPPAPAPPEETSADSSAALSAPVQRPAQDEVVGPTGENLDLEGGLGFARIGVARGGEPMNFRAAFFGQIFSASNAIRQGDTNKKLIGTLLLQGTVWDYLSLHLGLSARSNVNSFGQPEAMLSQGDLHFGVRGFYPVNDILSVGGDLTAYFPADFGASGLSGASTSVRPRLIASLDFAPLTDGEVNLGAHFNIGYRFDNTEAGVPEGARLTRIERFAYDVSAYDALELGVGLEYALPYVRPFLAFNMNVPVGGDSALCLAGNDRLQCVDDAGIGAYPKFISLGAKVAPVEHLGLHAGLDFGLTPRQAEGLPMTPSYVVNLGLSWTIDPNPPTERIIEERVVEKDKVVDRTPELAYIDGTVVDVVSGAPVEGARISYVDASMTDQASGADGTFRSYGFGPDSEVKVRVTHPDYKPAEVAVNVPKGDTPQQIKLEAIPKRATLVGRVLDTKDKPIPTATVTLSGAESYNLNVDAAGNFTREIKPGKYNIAVKADNYLTRGRAVEIKPNDRAELQFVLVDRPKKQLAELTGRKIIIKDKVFFETGKAAILPKSFGLLDQVAAVLADNPQVKLVQVEGHTDDVGKPNENMELSQSRAESVRSYLIQQGVEPSRLIAKGFGDTLPLIPNTSNNNRALNRRVEFNIVEQPAAANPAAPTSNTKP